MDFHNLKYIWDKSKTFFIGQWKTHSSLIKSPRGVRSVQVSGEGSWVISWKRCNTSSVTRSLVWYSVINFSPRLNNHSTKIGPPTRNSFMILSLVTKLVHVHIDRWSWRDDCSFCSPVCSTLPSNFEGCSLLYPTHDFFLCIFFPARSCLGRRTGRLDRNTNRMDYRDRHLCVSCSGGLRKCIYRSHVYWVMVTGRHKQKNRFLSFHLFGYSEYFFPSSRNDRFPWLVVSLVLLMSWASGSSILVLAYIFKDLMTHENPPSVWKKNRDNTSHEVHKMTSVAVILYTGSLAKQEAAGELRYQRHT
jgi:hypothetical protein